MFPQNQNYLRNKHIFETNFTYAHSKTSIIQSRFENPRWSRQERVECVWVIVSGFYLYRLVASSRFRGWLFVLFLDVPCLIFNHFTAISLGLCSTVFVENCQQNANVRNSVVRNRSRGERFKVSYFACCVRPFWQYPQNEVLLW